MTRDNVNDKMGDLVQEWGQRAVELMTSSEILKQIPIIKTVVVGVDAVISIRDEMLMQKLRICFERLAELPEEERCEMVHKLESDPAYGRRVREHLIELLDRLERYRKPAIVGEIFVAYVRQQIDVTMLLRLCSAVERLPSFEIDQIRKFVMNHNSAPFQGSAVDYDSLQALTHAGLTWPTEAPLGGHVGYAPNSACSKFVELELDLKSATK